MKSLICLALIASSVAFSAAWTFQDEVCGEHEVWDECPCDPTCENPTMGLCGFGCVEGCACQKPYIRHEGKCILDCPAPVAPPQ
uniref:TIL domain-containing protein n=1 Tax=Steinernema glaseri TaxID=37863 RepID=A0A1I7XX94_9BILA